MDSGAYWTHLQLDLRQISIDSLTFIRLNSDWWTTVTF